MAEDLTELEAMRINAAASVANAQIARRYAGTLGNGAGVYGGALESLGTGLEYDEDGNVTTPDSGYWKAGMPVASAPVRG